jgi:hypothetical protein
VVPNVAFGGRVALLVELGIGLPERSVRAWRVSDRALLTDSEFQAQFDQFGNALDDPVPLILEELARRG